MSPTDVFHSSDQIRAAKKLLSSEERDDLDVLDHEQLRRFMSATDHTERCTGHVHGPCDCGKDYLTELVADV